MCVTQCEYVWKVIPCDDLFHLNIHKEVIGKTRAKVAQTFSSRRTTVLSKSLMKRLKSSLIEQITYEKVRKLLALYLS